MQLLIDVFKFLTPLAYLAAVAVYGRLFFSLEENSFGARAKWALGSALGLNVLLLVLLGLHSGRCPLGTIGEGLLFMALILGAIHLISEQLADTRRLGLFTLLPAAVCVLAAVLLLKAPSPLPAEHQGSLLVFHIVASLASYACFSMAAILATLYLMQHRKLKSKHFDLTFRKLPPLEKLDKLSANWSFLGSVTMVASSVIGVWWVRKASLSGMTAREWGIYLVLAVFLGAGVSRRLFSLRGRRHALVICAGFLILLLVNLIGSHGFSS